MKCLVTGAAGFIGSHLSEYLIKKACKVVGIDNFMDYYPRSIKEANIACLRKNLNFEFIEGSLLEVDLLRLLNGVDVIFHQSAQAGVRASWGQNFKIYSDNNILATQMLLEACKESPVEKFVYASSSSVYGDTKDLPMNESSMPCPVSPYGVSKLAAENLCCLYYKNFGIPTVSLRYFTVYGARQRPDMAFHRFFRWALEDKPLKVYGDGEQSRDFTHVDDIVEANWLAFEKAMPGEVFNIGGGSRVTLNEVIELMKELLGRELKVHYQGTQKGDVRHTLANMTKAGEKVGYKPKVSIRDGLKTEYEWVKKLVSGRVVE
ncbi:MAG: GDP-mannose 4,6-dehydratase [Deltaproteobacteria bacterium]|nr:GDP-mannose 4,6-dehydratase [Deltaproteobacteria bacterium]MBW2075092.1 GDP-mannose 4,6-dehydratase [Deltaproteobacteria bacterium]